MYLLVFSAAWQLKKQNSRNFDLPVFKLPEWLTHSVIQRYRDNSVLNSHTQSESIRLHRDIWEHGLFIRAHSAHLFKLFYSIYLNRFTDLLHRNLNDSSRFLVSGGAFFRAENLPKPSLQTPAAIHDEKTARWINHLAREILTRQQWLVVLLATLLSISAGAAMITTPASCLLSQVCKKQQEDAQEKHRQQAGTGKPAGKQPRKASSPVCPQSVWQVRPSDIN